MNSKNDGHHGLTSHVEQRQFELCDDHWPQDSTQTNNTASVNTKYLIHIIVPTSIDYYFLS